MIGGLSSGIAPRWWHSLMKGVANTVNAFHSPSIVKARTADRTQLQDLGFKVQNLTLLHSKVRYTKFGQKSGNGIQDVRQKGKIKICNKVEQLQSKTVNLNAGTRHMVPRTGG